MKVIFLDFDGVMCLSTEWGGRAKKRIAWNRMNPEEIMDVEYRFDDFNKKAVDVLNSILLEVDVEIVCSSDWRFHCSLTEMKDLFNKYGVSKTPIDYTPTLDADDYKYLESNGKKELSDERVIEIQKWLKLNPNVTNWVAVDDLDMSNGLSNFVHTIRPKEGIKQIGIKNKILEFLK